MELEIHGKRVGHSAALEQHVKDRLQAALDRHESRIDRVVVRLDDVNGPKGGNDMRCRILVRLARGWQVLIEETCEDAYESVTHAVNRVKNTLARQLDKRKGWTPATIRVHV